jgi:hypothetical protein
MTMWDGGDRAAMMALVRVLCIAVVGLTLAACDKCGNSLLRTSFDSQVCRDGPGPK